MRLLLPAAVLIFTCVLPVSAAGQATITDNTVGAPAGYEITVSMGTDGELAEDQGDWVELFFDYRVDIPSSIDPALIQIGGLPVPSVQVWSGYGRLTLAIPGTVPGGSPMAITIDPEAGLINPSDPGTYQVGVRTSRESSIRWLSYTVTGSSVTRTSLSVTPAVPGRPAQYVVRFRSGSDLIAGEHQITIDFPSEASIGTIDPDCVTVNGVPLPQPPSVSDTTVTFAVPLLVEQSRDVTVVFSSDAGIVNPPEPGTYRLAVHTCRDPVPASLSYTVTDAVRDVSVTAAPPVAEARASYTIAFTTSSTGALSGGKDTISIRFPPGTHLPSTIARSTITVGGAALNTGTVVVSGRTLTVAVPVGQELRADRRVTVVISAEAGIRNPGRGLYELSVYTSRDERPGFGPSFEIFGGQVSRPQVIVSPAVVESNAEYLVQFRVSEIGGLAGGDHIYLAFPAGTRIPETISRTAVLVNDRQAAGVTVEHDTIVIRLSSLVRVGPLEPVTVTIARAAGIVNPLSAGSCQLGVRTTYDTQAIKSAAYVITGSQVSNVTVGSMPGRAGRPAEFNLKFRTGMEGTLVGGTDQITVRFPAGSVVPSRVAGQHVILNGIRLDNGNVRTGDGKMMILVPPGMTINRRSDVDITIEIGAGITNPAMPGLHRIEVSTTRDPIAAYSEAYSVTDPQRIRLSIDQTTAYVGDHPLQLDEPPRIVNGRTVVPLRFIADSIGAVTHYDDRERLVTVTAGDVTIQLAIRSTLARVNDQTITLDAPADVFGGRILVPLRFISEALHASVIWNEALRTILIER